MYFPRSEKIKPILKNYTYLETTVVIFLTNVITKKRETAL